MTHKYGRRPKVYKREAPRDLFNEANLLKCVGHVSLYLHDHPIDKVLFIHDRTDDGYEIGQDYSDGSIYITNFRFSVRGRWYRLYRPLNSREPWPLWMAHPVDDIEVFTEDGTLAADFIAFMKGTKNGKD